MWIRILLLFAFGVGLNWAISEQIKKQHQQTSTDLCQENYSDIQVQCAKKRATEKMIAMYRKEFLHKRL